MTPLAIFLLGCATVFLGAVQAAFSALMRLSLRLMAERGGKSDRLGHYLDDPLQLFLPLRLLRVSVIEGISAGSLTSRRLQIRMRIGRPCAWTSLCFAITVRRSAS